MKQAHSGLLTRNKLGAVPQESQEQAHYLEAVKAFARLTYESVYLIDYSDMSFEYVSDNPLFLCGYSPEEVLAMGYAFYFRQVPESDLALLNIILISPRPVCPLIFRTTFKMVACDKSKLS